MDNFLNFLCLLERKKVGENVKEGAKLQKLIQTYCQELVPPMAHCFCWGFPTMQRVPAGSRGVNGASWKLCSQMVNLQGEGTWYTRIHTHTHNTCRYTHAHSRVSYTYFKAWWLLDVLNVQAVSFQLLPHNFLSINLFLITATLLNTCLRVFQLLKLPSTFQKWSNHSIGR